MVIYERDIAVDMGTSNTLVYVQGKGLALREPTVVAVDKVKDKMLKIGEDAKKTLGRTPANVVAIHPIKSGVISDYDMAALMLRELVSRITSFSLFKPRLLMCVPSSITGVEERAVIDAAIEAGARKVYLVETAVATAIGAGVDIKKADGHMVIDIGGGTTEIAVISLGGIVTNKSIRIAGDDLTLDIQEHMRRQHNIKVGEIMAERIKIGVGSALAELETPPDDFIVQGPSISTALPLEVPVSYQEIAHALERSVAKIEAAVMSALEQTPPELYADIVNNGIYLTGGGALLRGLDKRLTDKIHIPFHIAENPLHSVAIGTGIALKNRNRGLPYLLR